MGVLKIERTTKETDGKKQKKGKKSRQKAGVHGLIQKTQMLLMRPNTEKEQESKASRLELLLAEKIAILSLAFVALGMLIFAVVALPVLAVVAVIYNSPFAIFFPPFEGESVQSVTSAYVAEFHEEVNELANIHEGYDAGRIVYVDYEGMNESPSNYYDIMAVYMIKHGMGEKATIIDETTKGWIAAVVDDMCDYSVSSGVELVQHEDGTQTSRNILYVNVTLRDYQDMISIYGFNEKQSKMLETIMSSDNFDRSNLQY